MRAALPQCPEAIENTARIAERCNVTIEFKNIKLPRFTAPTGEENTEYFRRLCAEGLQRRFGSAPPQEYLERLAYEQSVIESMGFVDYYLIVHDFIFYAKSHGIPVGPGRGSGAASLVAYCLGITGIDPIRYRLLFERFLNPERVSMPDFDIDFCYVRRQEVVDYVVSKYGEDHVAQIITFGTMAARGALRDAGRALAMPYAQVDSIAKMVPMQLHMTLDEALAITPQLKEVYTQDAAVRTLIDTARKLEGMPRHASTHAAGVLITPERTSLYVPLQKNDEAVVTQFPMTTLEELGLLKIDFLGLRNLTVIRDAEKMIRRRDPDFSVDAIPEDDAATYEMLAAGQTQGVFQCESAGMRRVIAALRPQSIEDICAIIALYRPGPMDSIPQYTENRRHPHKIRYLHPLLEPILDVTYGCIVYQEQVMQICTRLAGYTYGHADIVRRAMAKKKPEVMQKERGAFLAGCAKNGVDAKVAEEIFSQMESFASYAFNKAHAAAYALLAYQTAYLKRHYPQEYMAALLTSVLDSSGKVAEYIGECRRLGIEVLPPDVNESEEGFTPVGRHIRFGLLGIKNLGRGLITDLLRERETNGKFTSFYTFCNRLSGRDLNRRAVESLAKAGALDSAEPNRRKMLLGAEMLLRGLSQQRSTNVEGQMDLFSIGGEEAPSTLSEMPLPNVEDFSPSERLRMEREVTGLYLSGHPLLDYEGTAAAHRCISISEILAADEEGAVPNDAVRDGQTVTVLTAVQGLKTTTTKNDETMAYLTVEDLTGAIEAICFPRNYRAARPLLAPDAVLLIRGRISRREEESAKLIVERIDRAEPAPKQPEAPAKKSRPGLYLRAVNAESPQWRKARRVLQVFEGPEPVYVFFTETGRLQAASRSLWVEPNPVMLTELEQILGKENVAYVKK